MVLMEGRYITKYGPGRTPAREYIYRIVRSADVEKLLKKFNSASAPVDALEAIEKSIWSLIQQIKREGREKAREEKLAKAQEMIDNKEPPSDEQGDSTMNAPQNVGETASLREASDEQGDLTMNAPQNVGETASLREASDEQGDSTMSAPQNVGETASLREASDEQGDSTMSAPQNVGETAFLREAFDEQGDPMTSALQNVYAKKAKETAILREAYLPLLETEPFFRPLLMLTFPTRQLAVAVTHFCKSLLNGTCFHTYISKKGDMRSSKLSRKMNHYLPCLDVEDHQPDPYLLTQPESEKPLSERRKDKAKYHIRMRNLRVMRIIEITYHLAELVVGARGGLPGIHQVLRKTKRTARRDQLRLGEPAADIVIDVGIGGSAWDDEHYNYDKVVADFRDMMERVNNQFPDIMKDTKDEYPAPIVLHRLDDFGRRYDMETGELVPWPEAVKTEMPASYNEFQRMVEKKLMLDKAQQKKPPGLTREQLRERYLEIKQERQELMQDASRYFERHKLEIAMWRCKNDAHVTYFS